MLYISSRNGEGGNGEGRSFLSALTKGFIKSINTKFCANHIIIEGVIVNQTVEKFKHEAA